MTFLIAMFLNKLEQILVTQHHDNMYWVYCFILLHSAV
jgi:hypothetical protein